MKVKFSLVQNMIAYSTFFVPLIVIQLCNVNQHNAPRRHPYFDVVMGLVRSYDPESYAGGSLLLVGSPMPDRSKVMTQTKRDALALQVGGR